MPGEAASAVPFLTRGVLTARLALLVFILCSTGPTLVPQQAKPALNRDAPAWQMPQQLVPAPQPPGNAAAAAEASPAPGVLASDEPPTPVNLIRSPTL